MLTENFKFTQALSLLKSADLFLDDSTREELTTPKRVLAGASKKELAKWLEMTPTDVKKLDNSKVYRILSSIIPDIEMLSKELEDLNYVLDMVKDNKLKTLFKKHDTSVLQFKEILVGFISAPRVNVYAVLERIEKKHPELRKEIVRIKKAKTTVVTRLVKTTMEKIESGNLERFPVKAPSTKVLGEVVNELVRMAGIVDSLMMLLRRLKGNVSYVWDLVKKEVDNVLESLPTLIGSSISILDSMTQELESNL